MINVTLEGKKVSFNPISVEWLRRRDFYTFANFENTKCFIKKYEGQKPSAWELIVSLIGQSGTNMPMIYDAVFDKNSKTYYVFFEKVSGITLKEYILNGDVPAPMTVYEHIDQALSVIHSKGFWFSDFNEENIYVTSGYIKKFLLIDVDSCWSLSIPPNHISNEIGGIPGAAQHIGRHILDYYNDYLPSNQIPISYGDLPGTNFNYLQLLILSLKLNIFQNKKKIDKTFQYIRPNSFRNLQKVIYDCDSNYSKGVFLLAKNKNKDMRLPIKELTNRIINR